MIDRLAVFCLIGSACLGAILPLEYRSDVAQPAAAPSAVTKPAEKHAVDNDEPALRQAVTTALARPLFSATRRPPEAEVNEHSDTKLNDLRLTGILVMPDQHVAIFARSGDKPLVRSEGEMINDWHIDSIAAYSVSLSGPTGTTTLEPKADPALVRAQSAAPQPVVAPPPPAPVAANPPPVPVPSTPVRPVPLRRSQR
jgi:hypothetical protein